MFQNRTEAGRLLAARLRKYQNAPGVLLAVPRGGVPVAYEVARELNMPLEVILVKKIGHPLNKEYAIGAVGLKERFLIPHEGVSDAYIARETEKIRSRLQHMKQKFMGEKEPEDLQDRLLIVVDDGIATGNTLLATVRILKKSRPARIVIATPVASRQAVNKLLEEADEVIALLIPEEFSGVGVFYEDFMQTTDEEVIACLTRLRELKNAS